jgi:CRISPR/Cas system CSM-associated protein Csm3 (group 7 of RAMP superfamily)
MDAIKLALSVNLQSDFHTGTGYGIKGQADSMQMLDQRQPVIPRREFRGALRDRLEYLVRDLYPWFGVCDGRYTGAGDRLCGVTPQLGSDAEPCPVCRIFGSPYTPRGFDFADLRPPGGAELVAQPHVKIDPKRGRAEGDFLFSIQVARSTEALTSTIEETPEHQQYPGPIRRLDALLLVGALRLLRRLGGKQRRGLGRCVIEVELKPAELGDLAAAIGELRKELQACTPTA